MPSLSVHIPSPSSRAASAVRRVGGVSPVLAVDAAPGLRSGPRSPVAAAAARSIESALGHRRQPALYDSRGHLPPARQGRVGGEDAKPAAAAGGGAVVAGGDGAVVAGANGSSVAGADGSFVAGADGASVEILASDSGYENRIVVSTDGFATWRELGIDNQRSGPIALDVAAGTTLAFGIVNGEGTLLRAGAAALNPDGREHAHVETEADGALRLGFEDLFGGGDNDFNDAVIRVRGASLAGAAPAPGPSPTPTPTPAPTPAPATAGSGGTPAIDDDGIPELEDSEASKGNRSGLGDGSNPGIGQGTGRSPNTETLNPGLADGGSTRPQVRPAVSPARELKTAAAQEAAERRRQLLAATYLPTPAPRAKSARTVQPAAERHGADAGTAPTARPAANKAAAGARARLLR